MSAFGFVGVACFRLAGVDVREPALDFVGLDVEEVEAIFDRLVDQGVLAEVGTRREVGLKPRGRAIASDVIADQ